MVNKSLILGVGNRFRGDDGIGPKIVDVLCEKHPDFLEKHHIDCLDGGIDGLALLDVIKQYPKAIIIDAVNMNEVPGEIRVFSPNEAKLHIHSDALSTHGFGLAEVIALAEKLEIKTDIQIIGIQPKDTNFGENLSPEVASKIDRIIDKIRKLNPES
jgi:hydrogenase maturation protease